MSATVLKFPTEQAYTSQLHAYLRKRLSDPSEAEDIVQEAYLRYLRVPASHAVMSPDKYVFIIADNILKERYKQKRRALVRFDSEAVAQHAAVSPEPSPERQVEAHEELQRVLAAIPVTYRRVLLMNKRDGLSYHQIAEKLGLSSDSVLKYLCRATQAARRAAL